MQVEEYAKMREQEDHYWWFVARRAMALRLIDKVTTISGRVLDVGCGTGALLQDLQAKYTAYGVDFSRHALSFSASRGLGGLALGDAQDIPFVSGAIETVVSLDTIEHVPGDLQAVKEILRVLQPGGHFVMNVPAYMWLWGPHDTALMHQRRYTAGGVHRLLEEAGFEIIQCNYSVFLLFPVVVMMRVVEKFRRGPAKVRLPKVSLKFNNRLVRLMEYEAKLGRKFSLPWGSSVVALARKPIS